MTQVIAPQPVSPVITIQPVGTNVAQQEAAGLQSVLAAVANGTDIQGFVVNRDAQNNPILRTALGDVVVQSALFIKTGSEVVFHVDNGQAGSGRILTIDTLAPEEYAAQLPHGLTADTIVASQLNPQAAVASAAPAAALPVLQAVVLQAAPPATVLPPGTNAAAPVALPPALAQLPPGTALTLTVYDLALPPIPVSIASIREPVGMAQFFSPATPGGAVAAGNPAQTAPLPATPGAPPTAANAPAGATPNAAANTGGAALQAVLSVPTGAVNSTAGGAAVTPPVLNSPLLAAMLSSENPPVAPGAAATPGTATNNAPNTVPTMPAAAGANVAGAGATAATANPAVNAVPAGAAANSTTGAAPFNGPMTAALSNAMPPTLASPLQAVASSVTGHANAGGVKVAAAAPAATAVAPATANASTSLQATVIGHEADGSNILHTDFATLKLFTAQPLPTGTTLDIQVERTPLSALAPLLADGARVPAAADNFAYLGRAIVQLMQSDPSTARDLLQPLPVVGPKFTSGLLSFIAAVKNGDVREVLNGRLIAQLETLAPGLVAQLTKDVAALHQNFADSPLADWKAVTVPFIFQNDLQPARLYFRKEDGDSSGTAVEKVGNAGQRFVLDVHFSELGDLQFDGFIKPAQGGKSFELYLRSSGPLDADFTQNVRSVFEATTQATGLTGNIVFQEGSEHFLRPQAAPRAPRPGDGAHTILA